MENNAISDSSNPSWKVKLRNGGFNKFIGEAITVLSLFLWVEGFLFPIQSKSDADTDAATDEQMS